MATESADRLITYREASAILGVSPWLVREFSRQGRLRVHIFGHRTHRFRYSDVLALLNEIAPVADPVAS